MNVTPLIASEPLENRRLFAASVANGVLTVEGTDAADVITVTARSSTITVRVGAERTVFLNTDVDEVLVNALGGDDRVTLGKLRVPAVVDGGTGDDRLSGGSADDVLTGGIGDDRVAGGTGSDQLFGADGNDKLFGDAGDDELDGGLGSDLLNGGSGFDTTADGVDTVTGVEDDMITNDNGMTFDRFPYTFERGFGGTLFTNRTTSLDTTGFNVSPGTSTISPYLSAAPYGNAATSNPYTGVTLQAGGVFVDLPNTGAYARSLGSSLAAPANGIVPAFAER